MSAFGQCRVEYAIDAVVEHFFNTNELTGDNEDWEYGYDGEQLAEETSLPACDNDWDFKLLRHQILNDGFFPEGPHMEHDSDSDSEGSDCAVQ